jgi:hypothetical protein
LIRKSLPRPLFQANIRMSTDIAGRGIVALGGRPQPNRISVSWRDNLPGDIFILP